jgi:predicted NodU family carbamoyl transferase
MEAKLLSQKQLNWIATLRPEEDFRFRRSFGQTIVVATGSGGVEIRMDEDGKVMAMGLYGAIQWSEEVIPIHLDPSL